MKHTDQNECSTQIKMNVAHRSKWM